MPQPGEGLVEVWQQGDGQWRWAWRSGSGDDAPRLVSHRAFGNREEAVASAREAYPGLVVPVPEPAVRRPRRWPWLLLALVAVVVVGRRSRR